MNNRIHSRILPSTFIVLAIIIVLWSLGYENKTLDLQLHDTYFKASFTNLLSIPIVLSLLIAFSYWALSKHLNEFYAKFFSIVSTVLFIVGVFLSAYPFYLFSRFDFPRRYYQWSHFEGPNWITLNAQLSIGAICIIMAFLFWTVWYCE